MPLPSPPGPGTPPRSGGLAVLALVAVTAVWGSTFFLIKDLLDRVPVTDFLAVRFTIAAVALWLVAPRAVARLDPLVRRRGVLLGGLYGLAQLLQTAGLASTSASVSGFVTGMYVVLTPVFGSLLTRSRVDRGTWVAVGLAVTGLGVLALRGVSVGPGEALTLACAAVYALHIVGLGAWSTAADAMGLAVLQMTVIAAVCLVGAAPGGITLPAGRGDWASVVYMALLAGALAMLAQTWAQAHLPATRAAIIMTTEPLFAAVFAVLLGGESMTGRLVIGGALMLAAMYLAELGPRRSAAVDTVRLPGE